jgi:G:T-mismatch repair DNA endonuclease (very short patch repair protein)
MKVDRTKFPTMGHFKKNSEETRQKISEATKKAMANPEIRKKISDAHRGKPLSEEHKKKLRKYVPWIKDKTHSEEAKRKMSDYQKRLWSSVEYKEKMSKLHKGKPSARKGKKASEETRRKLSEAHKGKSSARKGIKLTEAEKQKVSERTKLAMANPKIKKKFLEANLRRYLNPISLNKIKETSRKTILGLFASGQFPKQSNTRPERAIKEELIKRGYEEGEEFIHQYRFMNKFMCDFCFPKPKVVVEVYGDFWHGNPIKYAGKKLHKHQIKGINRDKSKEAYIKTVDNRSWTYLVVWESDIKKDVAKCVDKIEEVLTRKDKLTPSNFND